MCFVYDESVFVCFFVDDYGFEIFYVVSEVYCSMYFYYFVVGVVVYFNEFEKIFKVVFIGEYFFGVGFVFDYFVGS